MRKLAFIFLIVISSTTLFAQNKGKDHKKTPEEMINKRVEEMKTGLGLSDEQATKVKVALQTKTEVVTKSKKIVKEAQANIRTANKEFATELEKVLTATQLAKHKEIVEQKMKEQKEKRIQKAKAKDDQENDDDSEE